MIEDKNEIKTKICNICKEEKNVDEFYPRSKNSVLLKYCCKLCEKEQSKVRYRKNKDKILERTGKNNKKRYELKKEEIKKARRERHKQNPEIDKKYYEDNREVILQQAKERNSVPEVKEHRRIVQKEYSLTENGKQKNKEAQIRYREKNRDKVNEYYRNRRRNDTRYRLRQNFSHEVWFSLKEGKSGSCFKFLSYTLDDLIKHLLNHPRRESWMTLENYGGKANEKERTWWIDHIKPVSSFNFKCEQDEEFQKCWALENLQPMEKIANIKKGDK